MWHLFVVILIMSMPEPQSEAYHRHDMVASEEACEQTFVDEATPYFTAYAKRQIGDAPFVLLHVCVEDKGQPT